MATEKIKSRIQLKYDTFENWEKATNFVPKKGEICIYSDILALKAGDGETLVKDLPYLVSDNIDISTITNAEIDAICV